MKKNETTATTKKQTTETATEKKQSRADATEQKRQTATAHVEKLGYTIEATANDTEKKKRFYVVSADTKKRLCSIVYSGKDISTYTVKASQKFTNSVYHEGWAAPYATTDTLENITTILAELKQIYTEKKQKAEAKKQTKKTEKTAEKQTEKKAEAKQTTAKKQTTKKQTATAEKKQTTAKQKKATVADLQKKATAKK